MPSDHNDGAPYTTPSRSAPLNETFTPCSALFQLAVLPPLSLPRPRGHPQARRTGDRHAHPPASERRVPLCPGQGPLSNLTPEEAHKELWWGVMMQFANGLDDQERWELAKFVTSHKPDSEKDVRGYRGCGTSAGGFAWLMKFDELVQHGRRLSMRWSALFPLWRSSRVCCARRPCARTPLREQRVSTRWHDRQEEILIEHPKVMNASLDRGPAF